MNPESPQQPPTSNPAPAPNPTPTPTPPPTPTPDQSSFSLPPLSSSVFDLVKPSFEAVKRNWQAFAIVNVFLLISTFWSVFVPPNNGQFLSFGEPEPAPVYTGVDTSLSGGAILGIVALVLVIALIFTVIGAFFQAMATKLHIESARGNQPSPKSLVGPGRKYMFRLILLGIVLAIVIGLGLALLLIPGIIAIGRLTMAPYHMVDKDLGVFEAMRASNEQAKQVGIGKIWIPILLTVLLAVVGVIFESFIPIVGPLAAIVIYLTMSMIIPLRYQQLAATGSVQSAPQGDYTPQPPAPGQPAV